MSAFNEHVLAWLRTEGGESTAVSVAAISGDGSSWNDDTGSGFYSDFAVEITWSDAEGRYWGREVRGADMASLWQFVIGGWGKP